MESFGGEEAEVRFAVLAVLFVVALLAGGLTGFNQQPFVFRLVAISTYMALGGACVWAFR